MNKTILKEMSKSELLEMITIASKVVGILLMLNEFIDATQHLTTDLGMLPLYGTACNFGNPGEKKNHIGNIKLNCLLLRECIIKREQKQ